MTFVATLRMYRIASRNFILVSLWVSLHGCSFYYVFYLTDYDEQSSHTRVIRTHYVFLLEKLDMKRSGLINQLYSDQVLSDVEKDDINAELTSFRANEKLLSTLSRKPSQHFQLFLDALDRNGQQHIHDFITGSPSLSISNALLCRHTILSRVSTSILLPRDALHKRGLCRRAVSVHPSRSCIV